MKTEIKYIDIVFENCEVFRLEPKDIYMFHAEKIYHNIGINCFQYENGEVYESIGCEETTLVIKESGFDLHGNFDDNTTLEDRLKLKDITHYDIIYKDGTNDYITVPWLGDSDYHNDAQVNAYYTNIIDGKEKLAVIINKKPLTLEELDVRYGI